MMALNLDLSQLVKSLLLTFAGLFVYFIYKGYQARTAFRKLRDAGLPMPPWHPILGHLLVIGPLKDLFPPNSQQELPFGEIAKSFEQSDSAFYLDIWPFSDPLIVISKANLCTQASQQHDLPKPKVMQTFFHPFAGGPNLFTMNGETWKKSRALFNPGFSAQYLLGQIGHIVEETEVYVEVLREKARKGRIFELDDITIWFTLDIIGAMTINSRLQSQRKFNALASAMRNQVRWQCMDGEMNPFVRYNPIRPLIQWNNGRKMNAYIGNELDKRFAERLKNKSSESKSIIDLALESYLELNPSAAASKTIDPSFKKWAVTQIRLFLFAGHDSTSSTICYCFYLLSTNPSALAQIREEHDEVFGRDISRVPTLLGEQPNLINQLPYTTAVIKEAMRLYPAASGIRGGLPGVSLVSSNGDQYPTEGLNIWMLHNVVQRRPDHWSEPNKFKPERWLSPGQEGDIDHVKGAWRPFEFGPRNCLGQTLVMLDIKVVLAMTVREFEFQDAYDEIDRLSPRKGINEVHGERAYQVSLGGAHPVDGMPMRVKIRDDTQS